MYKHVIAFLVFFIIAGCGFHLAGKGTFSEEIRNTHIQSLPSSKELIRFIEKNLNANAINVVEAEEASAILRIINEQTEKTVLTLDSDGKAREYELILQISFDVIKPDKTVLLKPQIIDLNRDFVFDKSDLLGANEEEQEIFSEMRNDAAKLIVYRLQTI